jgi:archaellum component FlaC
MKGKQNRKRTLPPKSATNTARRSFSHLSQVERDQIFLLKRQGLGEHAIADRLGRSSATVHSALEGEREHARLEREREALRVEVNQLQFQKDKLTEVVEDLKNQAGSLGQEVQGAIERRAQLLEQVEALEDQAHRLRGEVPALEHRHSELSRAGSQLEQSLQATRGELLDLEQRNRGVRTVLSAVEETLRRKISTQFEMWAEVCEGLGDRAQGQRFREQAAMLRTGEGLQKFVRRLMPRASA